MTVHEHSKRVEMQENRSSNVPRMLGSFTHDTLVLL